MALIHPAWGTILRPAMPKVVVHDVRSDVSNLTTYTFTNVNVGSQHSGGLESGFTYGSGPHPRSPSYIKTFVMVHGEDAATLFSVNGVTIGGLSGTEVVDRGGATSAINTALYIWGPMDLAPSTTNDVVVTFSEAVTACAIGVFTVENGGFMNNVTTGTAVGTGNLNITLTGGIAAKDVYTTILVGSTCATGGGTEEFQLITTSSPSWPAMYLYSGSNAEMDYAAWWTYCPEYSAENPEALLTGQWSGAGAGDMIAWSGN